MMLRITFIQALGIFTFGISSLWAQHSENDSAARAPRFFDDGEFRDRQTSEARAFEEKGVLVSGGDLAKQLDRKFYKLNFPKEDRSAASLSLRELYLQCGQSVFSLAEVRDCEGCGKLHVTPVGTGFAITDEGVLLTNRHVIESIGPTSRIVASTADGKSYPVVEVLASSQKDDVAVVRVDGSGFRALRLGTDNRVGTRVAVVSHPRTAPHYLSEGIVSRLSSHYSTRTMFISAEYAMGSSGAPVLDESGNVLGMVARTNDLNGQMILHGCIPTQSLLELFTDYEIQPPQESPDPFATEKACLKTTFAAMQRLFSQEGKIPPEEMNKRFVVLHASMMHAIEVCPDDPIAKRYSDFYEQLQRKAQQVEPREVTNR